MRTIPILTPAGFAAALLPMSLSYAAPAVSDLFARRGADDPTGHIRGEGVDHPAMPVIDDQSAYGDSVVYIL
jgi:hypothetical protein